MERVANVQNAPLALAERAGGQIAGQAQARGGKELEETVGLGGEDVSLCRQQPELHSHRASAGNRGGEAAKSVRGHAF